MSARNAIVVAAICFAMAPMTARATSVEKIHNDKVVVTEDILQPGENEHFSAEHPSLIVYMADGAISFAPWQEARTSEVKAGWTAMEPAGASARNSGKVPLHFARIEFLTNGRDEMWAMTGLPPNYRILHEDRFARTYEIRIPAGAYEQKHTHHARAVVTLQGAELEHILPDGAKQPSTLATGEIVWREGATHTGHNMGRTDLWVIAAEPK